VPLSIERREQRDSVPNPLPTPTRTLIELGRRDTNPSYQKKKKEIQRKSPECYVEPAPRSSNVTNQPTTLFERKKKAASEQPSFPSFSISPPPKIISGKRNNDPSCFVGIEICTFLISMFSDSLRICRKKGRKESPQHHRQVVMPGNP
jgi:hypothetical protein